MFSLPVEVWKISDDEYDAEELIGAFPSLSKAEIFVDALKDRGVKPEELCYQF